MNRRYRIVEPVGEEGQGEAAFMVSQCLDGGLALVAVALAGGYPESGTP